MEIRVSEAPWGKSVAVPAISSAHLSPGLTALGRFQNLGSYFLQRVNQSPWCTLACSSFPTRNIISCNSGSGVTSHCQPSTGQKLPTTVEPVRRAAKQCAAEGGTEAEIPRTRCISPPQQVPMSTELIFRGFLAQFSSCLSWESPFLRARREWSKNGEHLFP